MKKLFTTLTTIGLLSIAGITTPLILASCSNTPNQNNTTKPEEKPENKPENKPEEKPETPTPPQPEIKYPYLDKTYQDKAPLYTSTWVHQPTTLRKTNYFYMIGKDIKENNKVLYTDWYGVASYLPFEQFYYTYSKQLSDFPNNNNYIMYHSVMRVSFDFETDFITNTPDYLNKMEQSTPEIGKKFSEYNKFKAIGFQQGI